jgi:hypothetical protein
MRSAQARKLSRGMGVTGGTGTGRLRNTPADAD